MSTRCNINFVDGDEIVARIYQHCDGYPDGPNGVPATLDMFFGETNPGYLDDVEILAARFVAWKYARCRSDVIGIIAGPHGDEEYIYTVDCSGARPVVTWAEP